LLAHGRWFSLASSTTKTGRHNIAEILLKVALNTKNQIKSNDDLDTKQKRHKQRYKMFSQHKLSQNRGLYRVSFRSPGKQLPVICSIK
jgi:hypothetical protein